MPVRSLSSWIGRSSWSHILAPVLHDGAAKLKQLFAVVRSRYDGAHLVGQTEFSEIEVNTRLRAPVPKTRAEPMRHTGNLELLQQVRWDRIRNFSSLSGRKNQPLCVAASQLSRADQNGNSRLGKRDLMLLLGLGMRRRLRPSRAGEINLAPFGQPTFLRPRTRQDQELEKQPGKRPTIRLTKFDNGRTDLAMRESPKVDRWLRPGERTIEHPACRIVDTIALYHRPPHNCTNPVPQPFRSPTLRVPHRLQDSENILRGNPRDWLIAELGANIPFQRRGPIGSVFLTRPASLPSLLVKLQHRRHRLGERRFRNSALLDVRVPALLNHPRVRERLLPGQLEGNDRITPKPKCSYLTSRDREPLLPTFRAARENLKHKPQEPIIVLAGLGDCLNEPSGERSGQSEHFHHSCSP